MKIGFDSALGLHADALKLRAARTEVLAQNIANADTPGYQARDMDFGAVLNKVVEASSSNSAQGLRTTHSLHLSSGSLNRGQNNLLNELQYRNALMPSFDGNSVDVQTEQAAFAENNLQFQASLRFVNGKFQSLLSAIKGE